MNNESTQEEQLKIKKPIYKRWYFWLTIVVVALMAIGVIFGSTNADNDDTQEDIDNNTNQTIFYIGDKVAVGNLEYMITQVVDSTIFMIGNEIIETENNFIKITFTVKNIGNSSTYISSSNLKLYRGEAHYSAKYESTDLFLYELGPGLKSKEFILIFEVPDKSSEFDYQLEVTHSKESEKILLKQETANEHVHAWTAATCEEPKTCTKCGETEGEPLGHIGDDVCSRCGTQILPYHKAGMYLVGQDIPAGEYYVKAKSSSCYIEIASDSSGTLQSIIANENIQNYGYVTLKNGEYFTITNGLFIELDDAPIAELLAGVYPAGMYKIGRDIPAGEYYVYTYSSMCYFEIANASRHTLNSIISNESTNTFAYVSVNNGEYLTVSRGVFVPVSEAKIPTAENGVLGEGMYKVGRDIPAGEYKLCSNNERTAYVEVATSSRHILNSIVTNDTFTGEKYITVKEGQYLTITNGYLILE